MDKYQCLKLISCQVFSPNCQKITLGHNGGCLMPPNAPMMGLIMGASDAPVMPPCYFFLRTKIIFPIKCIVFSKNKNNLGGVMCPHDAPRGASDTTHHLSTTQNIPHQHTPLPPHPITPTTITPPPPPHHHPPPMEKKWGLNA